MASLCANRCVSRLSNSTKELTARRAAAQRPEALDRPLEILRLRKDAGYAAPDGSASGPLTQAEFDSVRRSVQSALLEHGTVWPLDAGVGPDDYERCDDPDFWVVDDWWSDTQKFVMVQTRPGCISRPIVSALHDVCCQSSGWGVACTLFRREKRVGYLLFLDGCVMRQGRMFWRCGSIEQLLNSCRRWSAEAVQQVAAADRASRGS